jgi:hypothetical protein
MANKFHKDLIGTDLHIPKLHGISSAYHNSGNWKVFYSNGTGAVVELALGGAGLFLQSNGAGIAPTWAAGIIAAHAMNGVFHTAGNWKTFCSNGAGQVVEISDAAVNQVLSSNGVAAIPSWKEVTECLYFSVDTDANFGDYRTKSIGTGGNFQGSFIVPDNFSSLVSLKAIFCPLANFVGATATLTSDYSAEGELYNNHSESASPVYSGTASTWGSLDISGVFTALAAGDRCGLRIVIGATGTTLHFLGYELKYKRKI